MSDFNVTVLDYNMGNLGSITNMLKKLDIPHTVASTPAEVKLARVLIIPGVGSFDHGIQSLNHLGLVDVLHQKALVDKIPILGLCLGMQLMMTHSDEGLLKGLGWFDLAVRKFKTSSEAPWVPHMGWNEVLPQKFNSLFSNSEESEYSYYFVHSYYAELHSDYTLGLTHYGVDFSSAVQNHHLFGVQFHPEKSHQFGMTLFRNFVSYARQT